MKRAKFTLSIAGITVFFIGTLALTVFFPPAIVLLGYPVPAIVAWKRKTPNKTSVYAINWLLGWTFIGWWFALAMAVKTVPQPALYMPANPPIEPPGRTTRDNWVTPDIE